ELRLPFEDWKDQRVRLHRLGSRLYQACLHAISSPPSGFRILRATLSCLALLEPLLHFDEVGVRVPISAELVLPARSGDAEPDPGGDRRRWGGGLLGGLRNRGRAL